MKCPLWHIARAIPQHERPHKAHIHCNINTSAAK